LLSLIMLMIGGCSEFTESNPEEMVRQRVNERWAALIEGRLETAYGYESPEYRELYPFTEYRKAIRGVGAWKKIDIETIVCEEKKCIANIIIYVRINVGMGFGVVESNARAKENWIHHSTSGQWYHISDH
ncbi:MAG: hypothetical protein KAJ63_04175, partial [Methyloprofundus sp.]|nr:hypothetical protein [Methyloprofundus sp.]